MTEKKWLFRYKDTVKETEKEFDMLGFVPHRTAEHLPPGVKVVIVEDEKDLTVCYIHSDVPIPGLELLKENTTIKEDLNVRAIQ